MQRYHDHEWGFPKTDDRSLFEKLCLEAFQCGLSWAIVLARRERLREVFVDFDVEKLVHFTQRDIDRITDDPSIIRHRGKVAAVVANAHACVNLVEETGSLGSYLWSFAPDIDTPPQGLQPPSTSDESIVLAKDLKRRGWKFVGPTTVYSMMQAAGMVNDHDKWCPIRSVVEEIRESSGRNPPRKIDIRN